MQIRDGALRVTIINRMSEAARRVKDGEAARIVTASRRMTDLWALAAANGLEPALESGVEVVGDRLLGLLPAGAWAGDEAPTLAVDDLSISGDTMNRLVARCARVASDEEDKEERQKRVEKFALIDLGENAVVEDIAQIHRHFALAFGRNAMPYATDFVLSDFLEISVSQVRRLLLDPACRVIDVTGAHAAGTPTWTCSLFPVGALRDRFFDELGAAHRLVTVAKVRLFAVSSLGRDTVRLVPMVLTRELPADGLGEWLSGQSVELPTGRWPRREALTAAASLVSMVLSSTLFAVFRDHLKEKHRLGVGEDRDFIQLAAGRRFADVVRPASACSLECLVKRNAGRDHAHRATPTRLFTWPVRRPPGRERHYVIASDDVVEPVIDAIREADDDVMSIESLAERTGSSPEAISVAVDILNDNGSVVSEFKGTDNGVKRGHRLAERLLEDPDYKNLFPESPRGARFAENSHLIEPATPPPIPQHESI
jgi:DNA-binding transcriptional ArsR family regulator